MSTTIKIQKGTLKEGEPLCRTCRFAHIQRGFRESEEQIFCDYSFATLRLVPFKVAECTDYIDRTVPTRFEIEKMALQINVRPAQKQIGFDTETDSDEEVESVTANE